MFGFKDVTDLSLPTRWPGMTIAAHEFPERLDGKAPSHPAHPRTGNYNGTQKKRNKGGLRGGCTHYGHGPCSCHN